MTDHRLLRKIDVHVNADRRATLLHCNNRGSFFESVFRIYRSTFLKRHLRMLIISAFALVVLSERPLTPSCALRTLHNQDNSHRVFWSLTISAHSSRLVDRPQTAALLNSVVTVSCPIFSNSIHKRRPKYDSIERFRCQEGCH